MANKLYGPRKRRTRQHVIADLAVHHVEGFILEAGYTAERSYYDYGYDLVMTTFVSQGYIEPDAVYFQIKASENLKAIGDSYAYDLDIRDYNLWIHENMPVILVLFDAVRRLAYWIHMQAYFPEDSSRGPEKGVKWVRVRIPAIQLVSRQAMSAMRRLKIEAREKGQSHETTH